MIITDHKRAVWFKDRKLLLHLYGKLAQQITYKPRISFILEDQNSTNCYVLLLISSTDWKVEFFILKSAALMHEKIMKMTRFLL